MGLAIYAGVYFAAEKLMYRNGHANPLFKMAVTDARTFDWLILGASHAMPLDFADFNDRMQQETGHRILNLAAPGTGPMYNRFVLDAFLQSHSASGILYVVDSFAFYSRVWNEDRFADSKLLRTSPLAPGTAALLWRYCRSEGVDFRALVDYLTGFSKINNRERFTRDVWEGELQFDRVYRSSASAIKSRIAYLFPDSTQDRALARYMSEFARLLDDARRQKMQVVVIKMPVPQMFRAALLGETAFDAALERAVVDREGVFVDLSAALDDRRFYFDTDHLNRAGVTELFDRHLKALLRAQRSD
jgi:hypothetical protein